MSALHSIYRKGKDLPIIGSFFKAGASLYRHPALERRRLFARDLAAAHRALALLYGESSDARILLDRFVKSSAFSRSFSVGHSGDFDVMLLYVIVRMNEPEHVIETGVASGRSSSAILAALAENGKGTLHSIDLPQFYEGEEPSHYTTTEGNQELVGFVPKGKQPGWLVPDELRSRWDLILGDSNEELPKLFARIPSFDLFYHDGDHSYGTMHFEFEEAWKRLPESGVLLSDDIDWNDAWKEFVSAHAPAKTFSYRHFGIARKTTS